MSGEHFPSGKMHELSKQERRVGDETYAEVQKKIPVACVDVMVRDAESGKVFVPWRETEPQIGYWFFGGRGDYGSSPQVSAAMHIKRELKLDDVDPDDEAVTHRFKNLGVYSTPFPVADDRQAEAPDDQRYGRDTKNALMVFDMSPEEVEQLNANVTSGNVGPEQKSGRWMTLSEIANNRRLPDALRQSVRDLNNQSYIIKGALEDALGEEENRRNNPEKYLEAKREAEAKVRLELVSLGLNNTEADELMKTSQELSPDAVSWAKQATTAAPEGVDPAAIQALLDDPDNGDFHLRQGLQRLNLPTPEGISDNGPGLRLVLNGAIKTLELDAEQNGELLSRVQLPETPETTEPAEA
jgi:hypothetical protein